MSGSFSHSNAPFSWTFSIPPHLDQDQSPDPCHAASRFDIQLFGRCTPIWQTENKPTMAHLCFSSMRCNNGTVLRKLYYSWQTTLLRYKSHKWVINGSWLAISKGYAFAQSIEGSSSVTSGQRRPCVDTYLFLSDLCWNTLRASQWRHESDKSKTQKPIPVSVKNKRPSTGSGSDNTAAGQWSRERGEIELGEAWKW